MDFKNGYFRVSDLIQKTYGVKVSIGLVKEPNTGDFDGIKITVAERLDWEQRLFVLGHLFGHTVQWNTNEFFRKLGQETVNNATEEQIKSIFVYEQEATRYFIELMHECDFTNLDQWATDFWFADWEALKELYVKGTSIDQDKVRDTIIRNSHPTLQPIPIPTFTPKLYESRWSF